MNEEIASLPAVDTGASVRLCFTYTREDIADAFRINMGTLRGIRFNILLSIGLIAVGAGLSISGASSGIGTLAIVAGAGFLALMALSWFYGADVAMRREPKYRNAYDLTFSDAGVQFRMKDVESRLQWGIYSHAIAHASGYLLYHGRASYTIIPGRAFANSDDQANFDALVAAHIPRVERRPI